MSMFISKALRRAEVFLEQVDESVAQASRRLVVEGATGAVDDDDVDLEVDDNKEQTTYSRASSILTAQQRSSVTSASAVPFASEEGVQHQIQSNEIAEAWGDDIEIDDSLIPSTTDDQTRLSINNTSTTEDKQEQEQEQERGIQETEYENNNTRQDSNNLQSHSNINQPIQEQNENENKTEQIVESNTINSSQFSKDEKNINDSSKFTQPNSEQSSSAVQSESTEQDVKKLMTTSDNRETISEATFTSEDSKIFSTPPPPPSSTINRPSSTIAPKTLTTSPTPAMPIRPVSTPHHHLSSNMATTTTATATNDEEFVQALEEENSDLRKELEKVDGELEQSRRDRTKLVKNLKRMKEIVSEMDESLRDKSAEARQLSDQMLQMKEELGKLQKEQKQSETKGKDELDAVHQELGTKISTLESELYESKSTIDILHSENDRLKEALLQGHEVELATADGARQEASQAHRAYEAEALAHRQTRQKSKEREENLQEEAALAAVALANAQRKAEEYTVTASASKADLRAAESKVQTISQARDAAFARIEDLEQALSLFERNEGEAPGQRESKEMQQTISELENALEAKNVELNRLQGEVEALRVKTRRDVTSPRAPGTSGGNLDESSGRLGQVGSHDVELKMRHMADSALRKQAQLEVLRSENRAMQHQLITERKRTREAQAMAAAASSSRQSIRGGFRGILDGDDSREDRMYGLRDGPLARFRAPRNWPKPAAHILTGMDRFSAQALAFLRREPILRIVLIVYVVSLHLFVYSLLHWHVGAVSGSVDETDGRVAAAAK